METLKDDSKLTVRWCPEFGADRDLDGLSDNLLGSGVWLIGEAARGSDINGDPSSRSVY